MSSGLNGNKFAFNGYLPRKKLFKKEIIKYENYKKFNQYKYLLKPLIDVKIFMKSLCKF